MNLSLDSLFNKLKELNCFVAANLNISTLWTILKEEPQHLYHLVVDLGAKDSLIDASSDNFQDLWAYLENVVEQVEMGRNSFGVPEFTPVDIRKGVVSARAITKNTETN